mmetsp:Transcript_73279/g.169981  ORF Transcript_73279/g.169981 Transcript_73279/m.169981 type:complete len:200 (+) Transcript_73279:139-738(+)
MDWFQWQLGLDAHGLVFWFWVLDKGGFQCHAVGGAHDPVWGERHVLHTQGVRAGTELGYNAYSSAGLQCNIVAGNWQDHRCFPGACLSHWTERLRTAGNSNCGCFGCEAVLPVSDSFACGPGDPLRCRHAACLHRSLLDAGDGRGGQAKQEESLESSRLHRCGLGCGYDRLAPHNEHRLFVQPCFAGCSASAHHHPRAD